MVEEWSDLTIPLLCSTNLYGLEHLHPRFLENIDLDNIRVEHPLAALLTYVYLFITGNVGAHDATAERRHRRYVQTSTTHCVERPHNSCETEGELNRVPHAHDTLMSSVISRK